MISKKQLEEASFWGEDLICLTCGAVGGYASSEDALDNEAGICQTCGGSHVVDVEVAKLVVDNLRHEGSDYGTF